MKKKEFADLKTKKVSELGKMVFDKKAGITKLYADLSTGKEKNLKKAMSVRRDIAQILTVISQMEIVEKETIKVDEVQKKEEK